MASRSGAGSEASQLTKDRSSAQCRSNAGRPARMSRDCHGAQSRGSDGPDRPHQHCGRLHLRAAARRPGPRPHALLLHARNAVAAGRQRVRAPAAADGPRRGRASLHAWGTQDHRSRRRRCRAAAPGSAVRSRLYHEHPPSRAHPPPDLCGQRSGRRAQRAGKALRPRLSGPDAANADLARPRRHRGVPGRTRRRRHEAALRQRRRRGVQGRASATRISAPSSTSSP